MSCLYSVNQEAALSDYGETYERLIHGNKNAVKVRQLVEETGRGGAAWSRRDNYGVQSRWNALFGTIQSYIGLDEARVVEEVACASYIMYHLNREQRQETREEYQFINSELVNFCATFTYCIENGYFVGYNFTNIIKNHTCKHGSDEEALFQLPYVAAIASYLQNHATAASRLEVPDAAQVQNVKCLQDRLFDLFFSGSTENKSIPENYIDINQNKIQVLRSATRCSDFESRTEDLLRLSDILRDYRRSQCSSELTDFTAAFKNRYEKQLARNKAFYYLKILSGLTLAAAIVGFGVYKYKYKK